MKAAPEGVGTRKRRAKVKAPLEGIDAKKKSVLKWKRRKNHALLGRAKGGERNARTVAMFEA
jgi:hypothetical protein